MTREAKILIAIMVVVIGGGLFAAFNRGPSSVKSSEALIREDSHKTGNGAVEVVEFGDYQCPACAQAQPTVEKLLKEYDGKITFVFRNFPLPMHPNAVPAAEAAEAAGAQGKYWEMHDKLYTAQDEWSGVLDPLSLFTSYASALGLDVNKFKSDIEAKAHKDFISKDQSDGYALGIQATPTFFVNGERQATFDYATLKSAIDSAEK